MTRRTIIAIIILLAVLGLIALWQTRREEVSTDDLILSVSAFNQTKNANAAEMSANPGDTVVYTLTVENPKDEIVSGYIIETNITDISELATLTDAQGANYNPANGTLVWTPLDVPGKSFIEKKFTVTIKDEIPAGSDMVMKVKFNNELAVNVSRSQVAGDVVPPPPAPTPTSAGGGDPGEFQSPKSGMPGSLSVFLAMLATVAALVIRKKKVYA